MGDAVSRGLRPVDKGPDDAESVMLSYEANGEMSEHGTTDEADGGIHGKAAPVRAIAPWPPISG